MADYFTHFSCVLDVKTKENTARVMELYNSLSNNEDSDNKPSDGFLLSILEEPKDTELWIRDDVTGDTEALVCFIELCAKELKLKGLWGFEYTNSCSRPRLDGFGGGAYAFDLSIGKVIGSVSSNGWLTKVLNGGSGDD